jgi:hypothetical protein
VKTTSIPATINNAPRRADGRTINAAAQLISSHGK